MAFRAFFSFRLWTATEDPAGMLPSSSPASSESEESEASSAVVFLTSSSTSSGSSSMRDSDMVVVWGVVRLVGGFGIGWFELRGGC